MKKAVRLTKEERLFSVFNYLFMMIFVFTVIFPFIHLLSISFSTPTEAVRFGFHIIPREISTNAYKRVFGSEYIWVGFFNTIIRTLFGTALSLILTSFGGYVLSKRYIPHRIFWTSLIVFTMFFNGGLIPTYLLVKSLGLINSYLAMVLPSAINAFYLLIMRNYFMTIPADLEESARLDGAPDWRILFSIILPISKPMLATIGLWIAVWHWNAWFDCLIYIHDTNKFVLQIILRRIILEGTQQILDLNITEDSFQANPDTIKAAAIFVTTVPIIMIYPFIQKYFVKGIMIGSLKG